MPETQYEHIGEEFRGLDIQRSMKRDKAKTHASITIPSLFADDSLSLSYTPESEQQYKYPQTSLPARGVVGLSAKLTAGILPMTNQPFVDVGLRPSDLNEIKEDEAQKKLVADASKLIQDEVWHVLSRSNLRPTLFLHFKRLSVLGDDMIRQRDDFSFETHRFDNYVVKRDMKGEVFYAILREFASEDEIPESIRDRVTGTGTDAIKRTTGTLYPLYTKMEKQEDGGWVTSQHFSDVDVPNSEKTYTENDFPYYFSRWNFDPYDNYGSSLVEENYGDLLTASAVRQSLMDGYSIATMGYVGVTPGSLTVSMVKKAKNWDTLPIDNPNSLAFVQPRNIEALTAAEQMDARMTDEIRRIFHMDVSAELTHERTTATQILAAREELNRATGGLLATFDRSTLKPIILTTIHRLVDSGSLGEEITDLIRDGSITIDVKSGIDSLGRESEYQNVINFIAEMGQVVPGSTEMLDMPSLFRWAAKTRGIPQEIIKTDQQLASDRQQELQNRLAEGLVDQAPQTGANIVEQQATRGAEQ